MNLLGKYCKNNIIGQIEEKKEMHDKKQSVARIFDVDSCSNRAPKGTRTGTIIQEIPSNPPEDGSRVVTLSACHAENRTPLTQSYKKKRKKSLISYYQSAKYQANKVASRNVHFNKNDLRPTFWGAAAESRGVGRFRREI